MGHQRCPRFAERQHVRAIRVGADEWIFYNAGGVWGVPITMRLWGLWMKV